MTRGARSRTPSRSIGLLAFLAIDATLEDLEIAGEGSQDEGSVPVVPKEKFHRISYDGLQMAHQRWMVSDELWAVVED